ncbi:MAG TPA: hypothetical protein VLJ17_24415 [Xanthobacteraceae bacterium]|nr:hypothetical protein [Xanthobacteraceae bacterium]
MAEPAAQVVSDATPSANPYAGKSLDELVAMPNDLQRLGVSNLGEKINRDEAISAATKRAASEHSAEMQHWHKAEGAQLNDLKPWDIRTERQKYAYDPIEAFGSFASVFAIAASAFTKTPMENALNGAAAAMNAVRDGKEHEYNLAHQAWQENTKLAIERGKMMHEQYQEALEMMKTDYERGTQMMKESATRYGDIQALTLLEHGYDMKWFETIDARNKSVVGMQKALDADLQNEGTSMIQSVLKSDKRFYGTPQEKFQLYKQIFQPKETAEELAIQAELAKNPTAPPERWAEIHRSFLPAYLTGESGGKGLAGIERKIVLDHVAQKQQEAASAGKEWTTKDEENALAEGLRFAKQAGAAGITGNQMVKGETQIGHFDEASGKVDKILSLINKHTLPVGAPGAAARLGEKLSNILGSNATDRAELESAISELKLIAPRLLLDANGRPLSAEHAEVDKIIRGLNFGDTTANTIRRMQELKAEFGRLREALAARYRREGEIEGAGGDKAKPKKNDAPWLRDPVVGSP